MDEDILNNVVVSVFRVSLRIGFRHVLFRMGLAIRVGTDITRKLRVVGPRMGTFEKILLIFDDVVLGRNVVGLDIV